MFLSCLVALSGIAVAMADQKLVPQAGRGTDESKFILHMCLVIHTWRNET